MQNLNAPVALEWAVAAAATAGGTSMAIVGAGYGLTNTSGVGAGFFPTAAGMLMALAGVLWALQLAASHRTSAAAPVTGDTVESLPPHHESESALVALLDDDNSEEPEADFPDRQGWARVGIIAAAILLAALLLPLLGYTLVMTLMLGTILFFVSKRKLWISALVAVGSALASRLVFEVWLGTALPTASIDFLAGLGL
ncbi:tripartite tricarboxylate transporter TctB family protein [Arthrobacter sp. EpRS71]|uniref:tripartite tricarboxylate transporter TctB family protein n=1 Tax=Arthrobacter sp. EpRS71 TaxID=1743141 RepID=UPI000748D668|nr:tripartite tricarboxylate transporter TctB family protein [Arthrobacter sp. EpRS71]KUM36362.1 hypothetical protein AR689_20760 [Arthrobacter sp. EpRS71]